MGHLRWVIGVSACLMGCQVQMERDPAPKFTREAVVFHSNAQCPALLGQYHLMGDPKIVGGSRYAPVTVEINPNSEGFMQVTFDQEAPLIVDGTRQNVRFGLERAAGCDQGHIVMRDRNERGEEREVLIIPTEKGFMVESTQTHRQVFYRN